MAEAPGNPESSIVYTHTAIERNADFIAEQNGLDIAGHLLRLSYSIKSNPSLLEKISTYQILPLREPAQSLSNRLFQAAKTIAVDHDPYHPISFAEFQANYQTYDLKPEDMLSLREHMVMYREAIRSRERSKLAHETQSELAYDWTGLLSRSGFIKKVVEIQKIQQLKDMGSLTQRKTGNQQAVIPPFAAQDGTAMIVDLDRLKEINDKHGHSAGDSAIFDVCLAISESIRDSDVAIRYGGDELLVLLAQIDPGSAETIYHRIRSKLTELRGNKLPVTISVGAGKYLASDLMTLRNEKNSFARLIQRADDALYHSKENGRDQLTIHPSNTESDATPPSLHPPESPDALQ